MQILLRQTVGQGFKHRIDILALCKTFFSKCYLSGLYRIGGGREAAQRFVLEFRTGPEILAFVNGKEIARQQHQANDYGSFSGSLTRDARQPCLRLAAVTVPGARVKLAARSPAPLREDRSGP